MQDARKVEVYADGQWTEVEFEDVVQGDKFRIFEETGEPVYDKIGQCEFVAQGDAHMRLGTWCIISDGTFL